MSAATTTPPASPTAGGVRIGVTQARVIRSEWTKLWSLRSTRWALLLSVVSMAGLGILISAVQMAHWNQMSPGDRATFSIGNAFRMQCESVPEPIEVNPFATGREPLRVLPVKVKVPSAG